MRNSKLISILILSVVLCITVITTASAVDMTTVEPIDVKHTALIGDTEIMPLATTSCSYCGHSSWVLSCNGAYPYHSDGSHYYSDVACSIRSHGDCTIHMRRKYVTGGACSHEACSGHFENPIDVGYHVETCYHTYTGSQTYNVCLYS